MVLRLPETISPVKNEEPPAESPAKSLVAPGAVVADPVAIIKTELDCVQHKDLNLEEMIVQRIAPQDPEFQEFEDPFKAQPLNAEDAEDPKKKSKEKAPEEEEVVEDTGPKYKLGQFKKDGANGDASSLLRPPQVYCHAYFIRSLYCGRGEA